MKGAGPKSPPGPAASAPAASGPGLVSGAELEAAENPAAALAAIKARLAKVTSPFRTAEAFMVEDIIDPRETRPLLCEFAQTAYDALAIK